MVSASDAVCDSAELDFNAPAAAIVVAANRPAVCFFAEYSLRAGHNRGGRHWGNESCDWNVDTYEFSGATESDESAGCTGA